MELIERHAGKLVVGILILVVALFFVNAYAEADPLCWQLATFDDVVSMEPV